jgi:hypothetical protein
VSSEIGAVARLCYWLSAHAIARPKTPAARLDDAIDAFGFNVVNEAMAGELVKLAQRIERGGGWTYVVELTESGRFASFVVGVVDAGGAPPRRPELVALDGGKAPKRKDRTQ